MATRGMLECELKLEAGPGFVFPDLPGEPRPERTFESLYFDTTDARLRCAAGSSRARASGS